MTKHFAWGVLLVSTLTSGLQAQFQLGQFIHQVMGRRQQDMTDLNKLRMAENVLRQRKFEIERQNWIAELRDTSYIEILDDDVEESEDDSTDN